MTPKPYTDLVLPTATLLRPAPGRQAPLAEWVSTTDRRALPSPLDWGNDAALPPINCRVDVRDGEDYLGPGTVVAYYHKGGELGCVVELDTVDEYYQLVLPKGSRRAHLLGNTLTRLDQGDEPEEQEQVEFTAGSGFIEGKVITDSDNIWSDAPATTEATAEETTTEETTTQPVDATHTPAIAEAAEPGEGTDPDYGVNAIHE